LVSVVKDLGKELEDTSKQTLVNTKVVKEYFEQQGNRLPSDM